MTILIVGCTSIFLEFNGTENTFAAVLAILPMQQDSDPEGTNLAVEYAVPDTFMVRFWFHGPLMQSQAELVVRIRRAVPDGVWVRRPARKVSSLAQILELQ